MSGAFFQILGGSLLAYALTGCSVAPERLKQPEPPAVLPPTHPADAEAPQKFDFENLWRQRALSAEKEGRLTEALLAWDVLNLFKPDGFKPQQNQIQERIDALFQANVQRAEQETKRGNLEKAEQSYLAALALRPQQEAVVQALRGIERTRNRRNFLSQRSSAMGQTAMESSSMARDREHLSMLVRHGEISEAIGILEKRLGSVPQDRPSRAQLADLYVSQAQLLLEKDVAMAKTWLKKALQLVADHAKALLLMRQISGPIASPLSQNSSRAKPD